MRALCAGSAMIDIIVMVASSNVERMTMTNATSSFLLLEQGAKVEAESISTHCGGGAVNTSVAMRRLGAEATAFAKMGNDHNAERIAAFLASEGVDASALLRTSEEATGQAVMVSSHDRNATIFTQRGANGIIRPEEFSEQLFDGRDLVHVSGLSNRSADCFPFVMARAKKAGAFVSINPGIRQITSRTEPLLASMAAVGLMAVNRSEANALVPAMAARAAGRPARKATEHGGGGELPRLLRQGLSFAGFDTGLIEFLDGLMAVTKVERVAVTDGTEGAFLADAAGINYCPTLKVEVMGTAGAGDAFTSTLAFMLASGSEAADALRAATVNAASVVTVADTTSGLLDRAALENRSAAARRHLPARHWAWAEG